MKFFLRPCLDGSGYYIEDENGKEWGGNSFNREQLTTIILALNNLSDAFRLRQCSRCGLFQ